MVDWVVAVAGSSAWTPATRFLLAVAIVLVTAHAAGVALRRIGQPAVVGEILAGLVLGPTVLGALFPAAGHWLFPDEVVGALDMLGQLGVVAFMLVLGMELRTDRLHELGRTTSAVAAASLLVPFCAALPVAFWLYTHQDTNVSVAGFALFFALALSITALPVLARILTDKGLLGTSTGTLALTVAGLGDLVAWTALAFVLAMTGAGDSVAAFVALALTAGYLLLMLLVVRPAMAVVVRWCETGRAREQLFLAAVVVGGISSALATQLIGLHAVIGALIFGAVLPRNSAVVRRTLDRVEGLTLALLLPMFFVYVGLNTQVGLFGNSSGAWLLWIGILLLAMGTKLVGVAVAARLSGLPPRDALALGALMNCRGLTELVVADIGFQAGIIDGYLFTALVLVALVTTALTSPLLDLLSRARRPDPENEDAAACLKPQSIP